MPNITYTDSLPGTIVDCFPLDGSLADWSTEKVRLTESAAPNAGRWTGVLDIGDWAVFEGGTVPTGFGASRGTLPVREASEGVVVVPVLSSVQERYTNGLITLYTGEAESVAISVFDAAHQPVSLTGLTLSLRVTDQSGAEVALYSAIELTIAINAVSFTPKPAIVASARRLIYSLRDTATNAVLSTGRIHVLSAP